MSKPDDRCQLYLVVEAGPGAPERLAAALEAVRAASVLIVPASDATLTIETARPLVELAQRKGAAALLLDRAELARTLRADGVHLGSSATLEQAYAEARDVLGNRTIVGVSPGGSRHDAMTLAEAGADYMAFAATDRRDDDDDNTMDQLDLVAWWAEIFELPCVAFDVESADDALELAAAGADFVGVRLPVATPLAEIAGWLDEVDAATVAGSAEARQRRDAHARSK